MKRLEYLYTVLQDHEAIAQWLAAESPHHMLIQSGHETRVWLWTWPQDYIDYIDWNQQLVDRWAASLERVVDHA